MSSGSLGLTRDSGYQVGVRKTLPLTLEDGWQLVTSSAGIADWLGEIVEGEFEVGGDYLLENGVRGELRVLRQQSHLRLTWKPVSWRRASTIQVRVMPKGEKCTIAFHQEHLPNSAAREDRKVFFKAVLARWDEKTSLGEFASSFRGVR